MKQRKRKEEDKLAVLSSKVQLTFCHSKESCEGAKRFRLNLSIHILYTTLHHTTPHHTTPHHTLHMHTHTDVHMHIYAHTHMHPYTHMHIHTHIYIDIYIDIDIKNRNMHCLGRV